MVVLMLSGLEWRDSCAIAGITTVAVRASANGASDSCDVDIYVYVHEARSLIYRD